MIDWRAINQGYTVIILWFLDYQDSVLAVSARQQSRDISITTKIVDRVKDQNSI